MRPVILLKPGQISVLMNSQSHEANRMSWGEYVQVLNFKLASLLEAIEKENLKDMRDILRENPEFLDISFEDGDVNNPRDNLEGTYRVGFFRVIVTRDNPKHTYTILGYAASLCKLNAITLLIDEFNADPNQAALQGTAPLHQLVRVDQGGYDPNSEIYKTAALLVEKGADPNRNLSSFESRCAFDYSPRSYAEKTAPSVIDLARNGMKDNAQGANCRAVFSAKDSLPLTFSYQLQRNAVPLAAAGVAALGIAMRGMK